MLDAIIRHGTVIDGSGSVGFSADVGVKNGFITTIGDLRKDDSPFEIEARGLVVAPGFIDVHTHSDVTLLVNPKAESAVRQGVTTHVFPNCGLGLAPAVGEATKAIEDQLKPYDLQVRWTGTGEYFSYLERQRPAINVVPMVAHGTIRMAVLGYEKRRPTSNELDKMKGWVKEGMKNGARGLCSGLRYAPGGYADLRELVTLCQVVREYNGIYASHIRSEGDNGDWFEAIKEAIAVGRGAGVPVQISHLKALGKNVWGKSERALATIEKARAKGVDVTCDQYPYEASSSSLLLLFPNWAVEGGLDSFYKRGANARTRERMRRQFERILKIRGGPQRMTVSDFRPDTSLHGKSLLEVARHMKASPFEAALHLLHVARGQVGLIFHALEEYDVQKILAADFVMVASDGSALASYGRLGVGDFPHPRSYGCFPRVFARYVREERLLSIEQAVKKMTYLPAARFKLIDRGLLRRGCAADIVVFDPRLIQDTATFNNPRQYPKGILYVLVNGKLVLDNEQHTGHHPGKLLRRNVR
jgi:N-acyl-D-amino-acid deacylase